MDLPPSGALDNPVPDAQENQGSVSESVGMMSGIPPVIVNTEPEKSGLGWKLFLVVFLCLFVGILFLPLALSAYGAKLPFVPEGLRRDLVVAFYKVPFLPKTSQQVLYAAASSDKVLTTYTPDFSMVLALSGGSVDAASFDLKIAGPVDFSDPNQPKFDVKVEAAANITGTMYKGKAQVRSMNRLMYFKFDEIPDEIYQLLAVGPYGFLGDDEKKPPELTPQMKRDIQTALENWVKYDMTGLESEARKAMDEQKANKTLAESGRQKIQDFLSRGTVLPEVKMVGKEEINGESAYHLKLEPSDQSLEDLAKELFFSDENDSVQADKAIGEVTKRIDDLVVDVWFGTSDAIPRKMSLTAVIVLDSLLESISDDSGLAAEVLPVGDMLGGKLSISLALMLSDIGKPVSVEVPKPLLTPEEYVLALSDAAKTSEQKELEIRQKQIDKDLGTVALGLGQTYLKSGAYPVSLGSLFGDKYSEYTYRQKNGGKGYVVYVQFQPVGLGAGYFSLTGNTPTGFYGISSEMAFPHPITQEDLD